MTRALVSRIPVVPASALPWITVPEMREVDRVAVELGIDLARMMENAGRNLAVLARALLAKSSRGPPSSSESRRRSRRGLRSGRGRA
jgi:hypothetical protein